MATVTSKRSSAISAQISEALVPLGFRVRTSGILTTPVGDDVSGWLGINTTSKNQVVEINIVIGIRSESVERLISEMMQSPILGRCAPTVTTHLGYLMPGGAYHPWFFSGQAKNSPVSPIKAAVREFGLPFMRKNASLPQLAGCLRQPTLAHRDQVIYRLPSCYFVMGDHAAADALCRRYAEELGDRGDAAAEQYRTFADRLETLIKRC